MASTFAAMAHLPLSSFPASQMMNLATAAPTTVPVAFKILNTVLIVGTSFVWFRHEMDTGN